MAKHKYFDIKPTNIQISSEAKKFFVNRKLDHSEPMYSVVDRCITKFKLSGNNDLLEENERLQKCLTIALEQKDELKEQLNQSKLEFFK